MSATKAPRFEHAELRVEDLERALDFYTRVVGLVELGRDDGTVYLGCGLDDNYDLALVAGGTGVAHFALRADDEDHLEQVRRRLDEHGVSYEQRNGGEPGQRQGIRFELPGGVAMEMVLVEDGRYLNPIKPAHPSHSGFRPLDIDHINLMAPDVNALCSFLVDIVGCRLTEVTEPAPGLWVGAWARLGDYHHDIGVFRTENARETLHHLAFMMSNIEHMKVAADTLAVDGIKLEAGPSRHPIGPNLFIYFMAPDGNRLELSAEGATIEPGAPMRVWTSLEDTFDGWGTLHERLPETFFRGS